MNMIDRVAAAIWAMPSAKRTVSWGSLDKKTQDLWCEDARRVLQAMREPTDDMIASGHEQIARFLSPWDVWQAMIDAALEGK